MIERNWLAHADTVANFFPDYSPYVTHWTKRFWPDSPDGRPVWWKGQRAFIEYRNLVAEVIEVSGPPDNWSVRLRYVYSEEIPFTEETVSHRVITKLQGYGPLGGLPLTRLTGFERLTKIIMDGKIYPSNRESGYILRDDYAVCFCETPPKLMIRYFEQATQHKDASWFTRWEPYGLVFRRDVLYMKWNGRPVLYLSKEEQGKLERQGFSDYWRCATFDMSRPTSFADFTHEREWRVHFGVPFCELKGGERPVAVVKSLAERDELLKTFDPSAPSCSISGVVCLDVHDA